MMKWNRLNGDGGGGRGRRENLIPVMTDKSPATDLLLHIIHCNCSGGCKTLRCKGRKHGLECTNACGHCQDGTCYNMTNEQKRTMNKMTYEKSYSWILCIMTSVVSNMRVLP